MQALKDKLCKAPILVPLDITNNASKVTLTINISLVSWGAVL